MQATSKLTHAHPLIAAMPSVASKALVAAIKIGVATGSSSIGRSVWRCCVSDVTAPSRLAAEAKPVVAHMQVVKIICHERMRAS